MAIPPLTVDTVLSKIHTLRVYDHVELLASLYHLEGRLIESTATQVLLIDSVAFHFRREFRDASYRTKLLNNLIGRLRYLATKHGLTVCATAVLSQNI